MSEEAKKDLLEYQLFSWKEWDQFDTAGFIFVDVVLLKDLGQFKAGEKFAYADIDYEKSKLELIKDEEHKEVYVFELHLSATFIYQKLE